MKSSLLRGTLILAGAALVARFLGVVQRIPLQRLLDDVGMASYAIAYNVYFWLLVLATAGFPSALAKLVSEKYALGLVDEGEAIRRTAARFSLATGVAAAALVYFCAPLLSKASGDPDATLAIRALAPALILFPWIAVERGYFHGRQRMGANGLSQIWEQILRVVTAVLLAYLLLELGYGLAWAAAGASFGGVLGSLGAAAVMLYFGWKLRREDWEAVKAGLPAADYAAEPAAPSASMPDGAEAAVHRMETVDVSSRRSIFRAILKLSIPVSVTALAVPTVYLIDSMVTIPLLRGDLGLFSAKEQLGILSTRAQSLAGIPVIFAIALSQSILPIISAAYARGSREELETQTSLALRVTLISGIPAIVVLAAAVFPLNTFIFGNANGSWVIVALLVSTFFQIVMMTSGSILLGFGRADLPMKHIAVGVAVKLAASFALAPFIGIYGITAATGLCFAVTMALNLRALRRMVPVRMLGRRTVPFVATVILQAAVGSAAAWSLYSAFHPTGIPFWDAALQAAIASAVAAAVYPALLLRTRAMTPEDMNAMPGPIRKLWVRAEPVLRKCRLV